MDSLMPRISSLLKTIICVVICLATLQETNGQEPEVRPPTSADGTLTWKFKKGQVLKMKMDQRINMTMELAGREIKTANNSVNELTLTISDVDDKGTASAKNVIDKMVIDTSAPGAEIKFDSSSDEEPEGPAQAVASVIKPMIGAEISQKMDRNGKVFDIDVPKGMLDGIKSGNPMMAQMFNENTIKEMTSKSSLVFPGKKLSMGDKWDISSEVPMGPATVKNKTDYEYLGVTEKDGKALHVIRGKVSIAFPDGIQGMEVDVVDEDSTVMFYFDGNAGRMVRSELDQNVTMEIAAGPQQLVQELKQKMVMEVKEQK